MRQYFIYKYEWPDGSVYIGQSHIGHYRYGEVSQYRKCKKVYNKMKKYPDFKKEILVSGLSEIEVDDFEIYYIRVYNSFSNNNPKFGLNLTEGGSGLPGHTHSEETRKKISTALKGKTFTTEHKNKLSESKIGKKLKKEHIENLSNSKKKPVVLIDTVTNTSEKFNSISDIILKYPEWNKKTLAHCLEFDNYKYKRRYKVKYVELEV